MDRFASVSSEEIDDIIQNKDAKNSLKQMQVFFTTLTDYCRHKKIDCSFETASAHEICDVLSRFWVEVRRADGNMYKVTSFKSMRAAIQRKLKKLRGEDFDIIKNREFGRSNTVFNAQKASMKKQGLGKVEHHQSISEVDMRLLYSSGVFDIEQPLGLLRKVFFEILLHLCRRGQENIRDLTPKDFTLIKNKDGTESVIKTSDELDKNHRDDHGQDDGVMKATGQKHCPVASFKLYVQRRNPKQTALFQRPKASPSHFGPWYDNAPVGVKMLETMMKMISKAAKLNMLYTNHCVRATCITILDQAGYQARHIMSVSGHNSEASIRSYSRTSTEKRQEMSALLAAKSSSCNEENECTSTSSCKPSGNKREATKKRQHSSTLSHLESRQRVLAERFDMDSFVPNFDLRSGFNIPDSDDDNDEEESLRDIQVAPTSNHLQREYERQMKSFNKYGYGFGCGGNVYNNCTFNLQPVIVNKLVNKRRRIQIESDSSQE